MVDLDEAVKENDGIADASVGHVEDHVGRACLGRQEQACAVLRDGPCVVRPVVTLYGLCGALDAAADNEAHGMVNHIVGRGRASWVGKCKVVPG